MYIYENSTFTRYSVSTNANTSRVKASVAASAALNTTDTIISTGSIANGVKIDANTLVAGSTFNIHIFGTCTSTNADVSTFTGRIGILNTIADGALFTQTFTSSGAGTNAPFNLIIRFTVRTIGAAGTIYGWATLMQEGTNGIYTAINKVAALTSISNFSSINNNYLNISYVSAAVTTTVTFQNVIIEQLK